jgi:hypothetical protein
MEAEEAPTDSGLSSVAVAVDFTSLAAAPANHSRTVTARPMDTGERWLTMSGISSTWQRVTISLELTLSSLASWWTFSDTGFFDKRSS